jgi:prepilin-type N-terminal cleavage/methylation domain-containing protein
MKKSAFSLIELSIVILVVGILTVGILQGKSILTKSKLRAAQLQTTQSPVPESDDLIAWWETTSERSFSASETVNNSAISTWYDINSKSLVAINMTQSNSSYQPIYKTNVVSGLPMLYFNSGSSYFNIADNTVPQGNTNYTVFVVGKFNSCASTCNILTSGTASSSNLNAFQYTSSSVKNNWNASSLSATASVKDVHIYSFTYSSGVGRKIFIDGTQIASDSASSRTSTGTANYLGSTSSSTGIDGYLGEVIIFQKNLKTEERKGIEKYLSRKWGVSVS